eukprot:COSAG01_NODE_708_length_14125_cov_3.872745_2_plen_253_part_00
MTFSTTVDQGLVASWQFSKMRPNYIAWESWLSQRLGVAPPSARTAWFVGLAYLAMETQMSLQQAIVQSGGLAVVLAFFVIFVATRSLPLSLLSTLAIATILCWTMGSVVLMGWKLGMMESTNIAILIGISVDFVIHFAHAYMHCDGDGESPSSPRRLPPPAHAEQDARAAAAEGRNEGRRIRTAHSLTTMGISVVAAAMTTLLSAGVLAMCTLTFFDKFGSFLCVTMVTALLLSIGFFQALLGQIGPLPAAH